MNDYRWNQLDNARGYDAVAETLLPHYRQIQDVLLDRLPSAAGSAAVFVDLGGGSGRLAERILGRCPMAVVWIVDQSDAFLTIARERLEPFGDRAVCLTARLQDDWSSRLTTPPLAIVSMSAIHHLDASEKQRLYRQCADCLAPGGVLMNGDEVRPDNDEEYLAECRRWAAHMHREMDAGRIPQRLHEALLGWEARNVGRFDEPRASGDDCHETADAQLEYFRRGGLQETGVVWRRDLWAVLFGRKPDPS